MAQPLKRDDWRILFQYWKSMPRGSYEGKTLAELEELIQIQNAFWKFMVNLKALCDELPEEESESESYDEGEYPESSDEENESGLDNN